MSNAFRVGTNGPVAGKEIQGASLRWTILRQWFVGNGASLDILPIRPHVVVLEFEIMSKRVEQSKPGGQVPKVVVELDDVWLPLEKDMEARGITVEEDDD